MCLSDLSRNDHLTGFSHALPNNLIIRFDKTFKGNKLYLKVFEQVPTNMDQTAARKRKIDFANFCPQIGPSQKTNGPRLASADAGFLVQNLQKLVISPRLSSKSVSSYAEIDCFARPTTGTWEPCTGFYIKEHVT